MADRGRGLLSGSRLRLVDEVGGPSAVVDVRLPSYRSLPLSCIERIELRVDGDQVPPGHLRLVIGGAAHALEDLGELPDVWWFVLDRAAITVSGWRAIPPGTRDVECVLVAVEPYITNGRFSFTHHDRQQLQAEPTAHRRRP